jgi:hypothetical protein
VLLAEQVDVLVADPSFQGTDTGRVLEALCQQYEIACDWHAGFELEAKDVPGNFRGPTMPSLALRTAAAGKLDAAVIGAAVRHLRQDPAAWSDRGSESEVLQELKLLWQVLVRFGHAREI